MRYAVSGAVGIAGETRAGQTSDTENEGAKGWTEKEQRQTERRGLVCDGKCGEGGTCVRGKDWPALTDRRRRLSGREPRRPTPPPPSLSLRQPLPLLATSPSRTVPTQAAQLRATVLLLLPLLLSTAPLRPTLLLRLPPTALWHLLRRTQHPQRLPRLRGLLRPAKLLRQRAPRRLPELQCRRPLLWTRRLLPLLTLLLQLLLLRLRTVLLLRWTLQQLPMRLRLLSRRCDAARVLLAVQLPRRSAACALLAATYPCGRR